MRRLAGICLVVALALSCAPPPSPAAVPGPSQISPLSTQHSLKRATVAIRSDPRTVSNKINVTGGASQTGIDALEQFLHAGLVRFDGTDQFLPQLAEAVPTVENGLWKLLPDGRMEVSWTIKEGVRWQDGVPFTSDDLLFTTTVEQDRDLTILFNPTYAFIDSVETPDPRKVTVRWKRPYIEADTMFTYSFALPLPKHLLERTLTTEEKANYLDHKFWTDGFVGMGPYRLGEWIRGSHLILQADERYVLGRPKIDEIEVKFIPDLQTLAANYLAGSVDVTVGRSSFSFEQGTNVRDQWHEGKMLTKVQGWVAAFPQFINPNPPTLADVRFRRALLHAIDRQQLADSLQLGLVPVAHSMVSPNEPVYKEIEPSIAKYEYDPRRAAELIEQTGFSRGPDGLFRDAASRPLAVELRTTAELDIHLTTIYPIADAWQRVGVSTDPLVIPPQRQPDKEYVTTFPSFHMIGTGNTLTTSSLGRYHSSKVPLPENNFQAAGNYPRYINAEWDALLDRYFTTVPMRERTQELGQIVHHMTDQLFALGIFYNGSATLVSNRMESMTTGWQRSTHAWNAEQWDIKS